MNRFHKQRVDMKMVLANLFIFVTSLRTRGYRNFSKGISVPEFAHALGEPGIDDDEEDEEEEVLSPGY